MNSIIQGSCHSGPNNPIAAWLEVSHLRGLQRSRSVRTQSLRWNSTWVFCCQRLRGKPFVCIPPHASLFQRLWLVGEWVIRGVAWAYQEHCPVWLLRFAFWKWFFIQLVFAKKHGKWQHISMQLKTRPSFGEPLFFHIIAKKVSLISGCVTSFSASQVLKLYNSKGPKDFNLMTLMRRLPENFGKMPCRSPLRLFQVFVILVTWTLKGKNWCFTARSSHNFFFVASCWVLWRAYLEIE